MMVGEGRVGGGGAGHFGIGGSIEISRTKDTYRASSVVSNSLNGRTAARLSTAVTWQVIYMYNRDDVRHAPFFIFGIYTVKCQASPTAIRAASKALRDKRDIWN